MINPEPDFPYSTSELLVLFSEGEYEIEGRIADSSNLTLLATVRSGEGSTEETNKSHRAIYKPMDGERPLTDFPSGLHRREVAMFRLASAIGWDVVPPTVLVDGPLGEGSAQAFVDANFEHHYFSLVQEQNNLDDLKKLCALDYVANNTDRKSGHCLQTNSGRIYGIDHGLTFHAQFKLRTVIWDFAGEPLPKTILGDLKRFIDNDPSSIVDDLLSTIEIDAMLTRANALCTAATFPTDDTGGHRWPWPLI